MLRQVQTKYGIVKGLPASDPRITSFKGVPFALTPTGKNRWSSPKPCPKWDGVKECYKFAPISVQDTPGLGTDVYCKEWHVDSNIEISEDSLYLNIWTPAKKADEKLPVLVWFFGGAFQWGYTAEMEFDGERLARRGIIVVSVNYRLNVFGFLAHPEITKENPSAPGNFGLLDQHEGLKWVKENIAYFGGDQNNITVAGQSAGGGSVVQQITSEKNEGLINKAVVMSGLIGDPYLKEKVGLLYPMSLSEAEKLGEEFFSFMGAKNLEEARSFTADFVLQKYNEFVKTHPRMFTIVDGQFTKQVPAEVLLSGKGLDIPIMAGNTADEFLNYIAASDEKDLEEKVKKLFDKDAEKFLAFPNTKVSKGKAYNTMFTPLVNKNDNRYAEISGIELTVKKVFEQRKANGSKNNFYYYRFAPDIPGEDNPGTFHSVDLWFFFETLAKCWRPFVGRHYDLSRQMCNYWANFIKTGNPNGLDIDGKAMPEWKPYEKETLCEVTFKSEGAVATVEDNHELKKFLRDNMLNI